MGVMRQAHEMAGIASGARGVLSPEQRALTPMAIAVTRRNSNFHGAKVHRKPNETGVHLGAWVL